MLKILKLDILKNLKACILELKKENPIWPSFFLLKVNVWDGPETLIDLSKHQLEDSIYSFNRKRK